MCNFDIESLYTNVPVTETINIILNKLFADATSPFERFSLKQYNSILHLCLVIRIII